MAVGAIGAVGAINYNPYVYNSRQVSSASVNSVKRIPDDVTAGGADMSGLVDDEIENTNPLRPGQTSNLGDVIARQMSMSALKRDQLFN